MAEVYLNKVKKIGADVISTKINYSGAGTLVGDVYQLTVPTVLNATSYNYSFNELGTGTTTPSSVLEQSITFTGYIEITTNLVGE